MAIKPLSKAELRSIGAAVPKRDWINVATIPVPQVEYIPEPALPPPDDQPQPWYVAMTNPRCEKRAQSGLIDKGFRVYLPEFKVERVNRRKNERKIVKRVLFPRYLFIESPYRDWEVWHRISSTDGIESIVLERATGRPMQVKPATIKTLLHRQNSGAFDHMMKPKGVFDEGDEVLITKGPFFSFRATVAKALEGLDDKHIDIELALFGQQVEFTIPIAHLESV